MKNKKVIILISIIIVVICIVGCVSIYKYNSKGEAIEASARIDFLVENKKYLKTIYKYINTGKMAPDGFYYWQGTGFQIDINNKSLHKKKKNITYKNSPLKT